MVARAVERLTTRHTLARKHQLVELEHFFVVQAHGHAQLAQIAVGASHFDLLGVDGRLGFVVGAAIGVFDLEGDTSDGSGGSDFFVHTGHFRRN